MAFGLCFHSPTFVTASQRILEQLRLPRLLAAPLLIFTLLGAVIGLGTAISGPAVTWATKLPDGIPRLQEHLKFLETPINTLQQFWQHVENFAGTNVSQDGAASSLGDYSCDYGIYGYP